MGRAFNMNIVMFVDSIYQSDKHPVLHSNLNKTFYSTDHIQKLAKAIEYAKTFQNCRINPEYKLMVGFLNRLPNINCIISINDNLEALLKGYELMNTGNIDRSMLKRDTDFNEHYFMTLNDTGNILQLETVVEKDLRIRKENLARFNSYSDHLTRKNNIFGYHSAKPLAMEVNDTR